MNPTSAAAMIFPRPGWGSPAGRSAVSPWGRIVDALSELTQQARTVRPRRPSREIAQRRVLELGGLPEDWDGAGAVEIDRRIVDHGAALLDLLADPPEYIAPHPAGTIIFEWESERGSAYLEIGKTRFSFYIKPTSGEPLLDGGLVSELDGARTFKLSSAIGSLFVEPVPAGREATVIGYRFPRTIESYSY
jgi:hypothetical protein